jgi:hypothetical protein
MRLSSSKSKNLSFGARLIYFFSFFKALACIFSSIESIFKSFFLGEGVRILGKYIG